MQLPKLKFTPEALFSLAANHGEKVLAAKNFGLERVLLPKGNEADVKELKRELVRGLKIYFVEHFEEVFDIVFAGGSGARRKPARKFAAKRASKPAVKAPAAKKPAAMKPAAKKPAPKKPVAKKPAPKQPAAKQPAAKKSAIKQRAAATRTKRA